MEIIKNKKGISLISVIITVILLSIILGTIILSNSKTENLKEQMLINADIKELSQKLKLYYLNNETIPVDNKTMVFIDSQTKQISFNEDLGNPESEEPYDYKLNVYMKLKLNMIENLNLTKKEDDGYMYMVNPITQNIYLIRLSDSGLELIDGSYSNDYLLLIQAAQKDETYILNIK